MILLTLPFLFLISFLMMTILILSYQKSSKYEKNIPFECGFNPLTNIRPPFSLHFFMISLIFLVFDLEIVFLLPLPMMNLINSKMLISLISVFFLILYGLFHEWYFGSLKWSI